MHCTKWQWVVGPNLQTPVRPIVFGIAVVISCVLVPQARGATYALQDLGTLPAQTSSVAWAINASGDVVGWSGTSPPRAFLYRDGIGMVELRALPGQTSTLARGINDAGVVVGSGWGPGNPQHAVRWTEGMPVDLGVLDGTSEGWDINSAGIAVGSSPTLDYFVRHAFVHSDGGGMVDIAPSLNASAYDVDDAGQVTGSASTGAFLWSADAGLQILGTLDGFPFSHGRGVNVSGQVAGFVTSATGNRERVFRYTPGLGLVNLGGVGETNVVLGMNSQGAFVGQGSPNAGLKRAFVYTDEGGLQALNDLIDASPQWFLLSATDINDKGQIVGYGFDNLTQQLRAYRLTPVTSVGALAHLALNPVKLMGGSAASGWVTLADPAPAGGAIVTLASEDPAMAALPASVRVIAGERHASFPVTTDDPVVVTNVRLTASYQGVTRSAVLTIDPAAVTAVGPAPVTGRGLRILAYPNPAALQARVRIELARGGDVEICIHDIRGRLIRALRQADRPSGWSDVTWDLRDESGALVDPGVFYVQGDAGGLRATARIVVLSRLE